MAKRFTETGKWEDPWFCSLNIRNQMFWVYLLDKCNHAGIWQVNWPLVQFHIKGFRYQADAFKERILEINPFKWFIPKFIQFQYGTLNESNRAHASVIAMLEKEGASKALASPMLGAKDKDKDKAKDKEEDVIPKNAFEFIWNKYPRRLGKNAALRHFKATVKTPQDWTDIQKAIGNFMKQMSQESRDDEFVQHGSTWFHNWRDWVDYKGAQFKQPASVLPKFKENIPAAEDIFDPSDKTEAE